MAATVPGLRRATLPREEPDDDAPPTGDGEAPVPAGDIRPAAA
ncbi:hypothetical protein ACWCQ0_46100 [Streptomyces massasporeus]